MSRLDYSKWDNLEISDDEDIECHPNIDKASFIRWRRAEIHRRRQERRDKIASFKAERVMNVALIKRLKHLEETQPIKDDATLTAVANDYRERGRAPDAERQEEGPSFDEMIAVLLLQIQDEFRAKQKEGSLDNEADWLAEKIREHRGKLEKRQEEIAVELPKLEREEQRILTVDNVCHEGFSRTIINKEKPFKPKKKEETIEVLNPGYEKVAERKEAQEKEASKSTTNGTPIQRSGDEDEGDIYIRTEEARDFANIDNFPDSYRMLKQHPWLIKEEISDQILAEAFELQLAGKKKQARLYVQQAKIIQYCAELGARGYEAFFSRLMGPESKAQVVFNEDVEKTYAHIKKRCVVIRKEREEREKKRQEIAKGDPNEPVEIEVPEDATEYERKRAEAFRTFPPPFQRALLSGDLDKLNEVLSTMDSEEAERVLELCKSTGLLEIEEGVDEEMEEANPESTEEAKPETDDANQ